MGILSRQLAKGGTWGYGSVTDPRWNCSGVTNRNAFYAPPKEAEAKLAEMKAQYGEPPPDLTFWFERD